MDKNNSTGSSLNWTDFMKVEMRVGTIIEAERLEEAKMPAYRIKVDFGEFGIKKTSAQITKLYTPDSIVGKQVIAVINFPPKQIANMMSECLILGAMGEDNEVILVGPERNTANGLRIG